MAGVRGESPRGCLGEGTVMTSVRGEPPRGCLGEGTDEIREGGSSMLYMNAKWPSLGKSTLKEEQTQTIKCSVGSTSKMHRASTQ